MQAQFRRVLGGWLAVAFFVMASAQTTTADINNTETCRALEHLRLNNVNLLSATTVAATDDLPAFCSVRGYVRPAINFEVRLPADWNGGFYMAGCGGFCGQLLSDAPGFINAMNYGLARGYAAATMDGGHWGTGSTDGRWAYHNRLAEVDWGDRAVRETARVALTLINSYYNQAPNPRIFAGCSTGGRQANMLAVRDPELFDGIINGAPALDYTGLVATFMAAVVQYNTDASGAQIITPAHLELVRNTVYGQCDAADGLEDGLISNPNGCSIDWSTVTCSADAEGDCLSEAQVAVLAGWYETGAVNSAGQQLYPATIPYGSEPYWGLWLTGNPGGSGRLVPVFNSQFLQFMAFPDDPGETFSSLDFNFDEDPARLELMSSIYNADDPDLAAFAAAGGKMITWHGLADAIVPHGKTVHYYQQAANAAGGVATLREYNRLFLIPGMDHCGILPGPGITSAGFDPLTALETWLETGQAPDTLTISRPADDTQTAWSRPICAYPDITTYMGGEWREAGNFSCTTP